LGNEVTQQQQFAISANFVAEVAVKEQLLEETADGAEIPSAAEDVGAGV
jgi:hypothetical protein